MAWKTLIRNADRFRYRCCIRPVHIVSGLTAAVGVSICAPFVSAATYEPYQVAVLRGLDKVTARISTFEGRVDEEVPFGGLVIRVEACYKTPPVEPPESASFLRIRDEGPTRERQGEVFAGWMFASSPGLSALQHPVYDIWVIDCLERQTRFPPEGEGAPPTADPQADGADPASDIGAAAPVE